MSPGRRAQGAGSGGDVEAEAALERVEELDRLDAGAARARLEVQPLTRAVLAHGDEVCSTASGDVGGGVGGVPRLPCGEACPPIFVARDAGELCLFRREDARAPRLEEIGGRDFALQISTPGQDIRDFASGRRDGRWGRRVVRPSHRWCEYEDFEAGDYRVCPVLGCMRF